MSEVEWHVVEIRGVVFHLGRAFGARAGGSDDCLRRLLGVRLLFVVGIRFGQVEQRVALQHQIQLGLQLHARQLQQADGVLQLRGERKLRLDA